MKKFASITKKMKNKPGFSFDQFLRLKSNFLFYPMVLCAVLISSTLLAENSASMAENFDINLNLQNMHTWHGSVVTPGIMTATSLEFLSTNRKFTIGLWGGASTDGDYKEFSYYSNYSFTDKFNASLISHNNYSNSENPDIFSYDKYTSPNFVDIVLEYKVSHKLPLTLYWSTILFGNGGDYETDEDGSVTDSYSTYTEIRYQLFPQQETQVTLFAGGAFSPTTEKTFYSDQASLLNFGLTINKNILILSHHLPVSATAFWNPETKIGALQLSTQLF